MHIAWFLCLFPLFVLNCDVLIHAQMHERIMLLEATSVLLYFVLPFRLLVAGPLESRITCVRKSCAISLLLSHSYAYAHTHTHTDCSHACAHTRTHAHKRARTHTRTHAHKRARTHTHTRMHMLHMHMLQRSSIHSSTHPCHKCVCVCVMSERHTKSMLQRSSIHSFTHPCHKCV